ncbi:MAG: helix-turn-helix domain-containing protein [Bullifex sp.]
MDKLFTIKEVSLLLKCNVNRVHELRKSGLLKCMKLGSYKVTETSLNNFLSQYDGMDVSDPERVCELK